MNLDGILKLVDAGFSKDEIIKLTAADSKPVEQPKVEEKVEDKVEEHKEVKVETTLEDKFNKLMEKLDGMNFHGANQPAETTVDDIIASIINPKE